MHSKRETIPKSWPVPRKGTAYVVRPSHSLKKGIPLLIVLRDLLKLARNRKEVKKALHEKKVALNNKPATDEKNPLLLYDVLTILPAKKHFRLELSEKGKFCLKEIPDSESGTKIAKIIDKKILKGNKTQLNLSDGRNFLSDIKCKVNDSVVIDLKNRKIEKCLPLKEKAKAVVFEGKHSGKRGEIIKIDNERKMVELSVESHEKNTAEKKGESKKINVLIKQLMVIK